MTTLGTSPPAAPTADPVEVERTFPPPWLRRAGSWFLNGYAVLGLLYLFAPIFVIVLFSFNAPKGRFNIVWQRFTLDNWAHPFAEKELVDAFDALFGGHDLRSSSRRMPSALPQSPDCSYMASDSSRSSRGM